MGDYQIELQRLRMRSYHQCTKPVPLEMVWCRQVSGLTCIQMDRTHCTPLSRGLPLTRKEIHDRDGVKPTAIVEEKGVGVSVIVALEREVSDLHKSDKVTKASAEDVE